MPVIEWAVAHLVDITRLVLFGLFCIKARGLIIGYLKPFLDKYRHTIDEHWTTLQEQHMVLIAQKKQLATQFLQQEKQIALLTAKLEQWRHACAEKEKARQGVIAQRAVAMNARAALQQHNTAQKEMIRTAGLAIIREETEAATKHADALFDVYIKQGLAVLEKAKKSEMGS